MKTTRPAENEDTSQGPERRDSVVDRRSGLDRRDMHKVLNGVDGANGDLSTNLERRRGPGRRRTDFMKSAEEGEMTPEQFLFVMAIDAFKRVNGKTFPTWTEVLEVIRHLGYRKVQARDIKLENCPEPELFKLDDRRNADAA